MQPVDISDIKHYNANQPIANYADYETEVIMKNIYRGEINLDWVEIKKIYTEYFCNYAAGGCTSEGKGTRCCHLHYKGFQGRDLGLNEVCEAPRSVSRLIIFLRKRKRNIVQCLQAHAFLFVHDENVNHLSLMWFG